MKLLSRNSEIELLRRQRWLSEEQFSRMTLVTGKRLSGKTALISEAYSDKPFLYFRLTGKTDVLQLEEFAGQLSSKLGLQAPESASDFRQLMDYIFSVSDENPMTVVLEDFDELLRRNPGYFKVLRSYWKNHRKDSNVNLVLTMSNPLHAESIFDAPGAPLLNTLDMKIHLDFLSIADMKACLDASGRKWTCEDLYILYMLTGGCPKFVSYALDNNALTKDELLKLFFRDGSPYVWEIRSMLYALLGHNSEVYLSLLQLIATGPKTLGELEERLGGIIVGGHLAKLENEYGLVVKTRPVLADPKSRNVVRYEIADQMTDCWLRYVEAFRDLVETGNWPALLGTMDRDSRTYAKHVLRRYFREKFAQENGMTEIGGDWKSGREKVYELDIVGIDRSGKHALVADVEMGAETFEKDPFLNRVNALKDGPLWGYSVDTRLFTLSDM